MRGGGRTRQPDSCCLLKVEVEVISGNSKGKRDLDSQSFEGCWRVTIMPRSIAGFSHWSLTLGRFVLLCFGVK